MLTMAIPDNSLSVNRASYTATAELLVQFMLTKLLFPLVRVRYS